MLTNELKLIFIVYEDGKMFPEPMMMAEDNVTIIPTEIKSCVLVTKLVGVEMEVTPEPLIIALRQPENYDRYLTMRPSPSWWDPLSGLWDINPNTSCQLAHIGDGMLVYKCTRFGYFSLTMSPTLIHNILPRTNAYGYLYIIFIILNNFLYIIIILFINKHNLLFQYY